MVNPKALGVLVTRRRKELGIKQRELSIRVDIEQGYLSRLERGKLPYIPGTAILSRLAHVLECDSLEIHWLAGRIPAVEEFWLLHLSLKDLKKVDKLIENLANERKAA